MGFCDDDWNGVTPSRLISGAGKIDKVGALRPERTVVKRGARGCGL